MFQIYEAKASKEIGRPSHPISELFQIHEIIELPGCDRPRINDDFVELYENGMSLRDIARVTGKAKNTVRDALQRTEVELRPKVTLSTVEAKGARHKSNVRPFYGFCYFQGSVVPDQREFENLILVHRLWKSGANPNRIAETLNSRKVPARSAKVWNRNTVVNIITRFENKTVVIKKDGSYELR